MVFYELTANIYMRKGTGKESVTTTNFSEIKLI